MEMATSESQSRPDVISYCLANPKFRERWQNIFRLGDEHMRDARLNCQDLFLSEYWESLEKFVLENGEMDPKSDEVCRCMFRMILDHFNDMEHEDADQKQRLSQRVVYDNIKNSYEENPKPFITSLCQFLQEEQRLLAQFMSAEAESMDVSSNDDQDHIIECMDKSSKNIKICINKLESLEDQLINQVESTVPGFEELTGGSNGINLSDLQKRQNRSQQKKAQLIADIRCHLQNIETKAIEAEAILEKKMVAFKNQLKLFYVDLVNHRPPIPTEVERGYCWMGKILYDNLQYDLPKLESLVGFQMVQSTACHLRSCFERLLKSSFVVTEQQKHIIKVELGSKKRNKEAGGNKEETTNQKFRCPKFYATVRLLACDNIHCIGKVKAQFCYESEVNEKFQSGEWEGPCEIKLKANTDECSFEKKALASFKKLEIENFERKQDIQVCEDKFRIVFTTRVRVADQDSLVSTISLPIVITTGANQCCNVQGSLLWQCFSTDDAFQLPIESANSLKWHIVFDMLNAKMQTLGGRDLSDDEKAHLGSRLMLEENPVPDEMDVPFRRFCVDKMMDIKEGDDKKKSATFWMWFLAVFNLTKFHLQDYWNDGLICGFIKKETAEQKLRSNIHNMQDYTYLLRFSDTVITDCQGQNLCGAISATVFYKSKKGKWKSLSTEPFKAEKFKVQKKTLAQCVKTTYVKNTDSPAPDGNNVQLLKWLYKSSASLISTDEAFQTYFTESKSRKENANYKKLEEILVLFNDMSVDDESSPERKREIKKAVAPSKKRQAANTRSGVVKSKRLSEPQPDPVMYSSEATQTDSPMSVPPESPQYSTGIPQTVLELNEGQSQGSMKAQPFVSTQDMETSSLGNVQSFGIEEESLSSAHPTLSRMLFDSSNTNSFLTIDEEALGQTLLILESDHEILELLEDPQQQTSNTDVMYSNNQQVSPAPSMDFMQQPGTETSMSSPVNSAQSLHSPDNNQHSVSMASIVYAPASTTTEESKGQVEDQKLAKMKEKMMLFEKLRSKIGGGSSESSVSSSGSQAFSPQDAATLQSPPHSAFPLAASPAESIQTNSVQSPYSQSVYSDASSPAGSVASSIISNNPTNKNELIQNMHNIFEEINASFQNSGSRVPA